MLNMIIIPTLSLSAGTGVTSIWSYIQKKDIEFSELLGDLYLGNTGQFYVSLVIQQAFMTSAFYLLNLSDLMMSYYSPWLAHFRR